MCVVVISVQLICGASGAQNTEGTKLPPDVLLFALDPRVDTHILHQRCPVPLQHHATFQVHQSRWFVAGT